MNGKDILDGSNGPARDIQRRLEHVGREPSPVNYTVTEVSLSVMGGELDRQIDEVAPQEPPPLIGWGPIGGNNLLILTSMNGLEDGRRMLQPWLGLTPRLSCSPATCKPTRSP